ncbi:MAG TPA: SDR family NAD(P)-dependent oxidoreductase [Clostridia bacterium]
MKNILVTGATGFLGKKVSEELVKSGYNVIGMGRNRKAGEYLVKKGIHFLEADLRDEESIISSCKNIDCIVHSGALSSPWGKYKDFYDINVKGTEAILKGAKKHQVKKIIYVSSPSIYFDFTDKFNIKESDKLPLKFASYYSETKYLAEEVLDKASGSIDYITIRPRAIYGIGDTTLFPRIISANKKTGVPLINEGKQILDITSVENVAHAIMLCMNVDSRATGQKFNITDGEPMEFRSILKMLFEGLETELRVLNISYKTAYNLSYLMELLSKYLLFGKEPLFTRYSLGVISKSQTLDISKARDILGYRPVISTSDSIKNVAGWWRANQNGRDGKGF